LILFLTVPPDCKYLGEILGYNCVSKNDFQCSCECTYIVSNSYSYDQCWSVPSTRLKGVRGDEITICLCIFLILSFCFAMMFGAFITRFPIESKYKFYTWLWISWSEKKSAEKQNISAEKKKKNMRKERVNEFICIITSIWKDF